ncbi:hypothetical protein N665_0019s0012 [Sinapis alba]|nr:hypothetical protein N665_0019s0012 [Sinapis alba]
MDALFSSWVAWVRKRYLSWLFCRLLKLRPTARSFLRIEVHGGGETFFWHDPWTPFGDLLEYLGPSGPANLGIPMDSLISDIIIGSSWVLRPARTDRQVHFQAYLLTIPLTQEADYAVWKVDDKVCSNFSAKSIWRSLETRNHLYFYCSYSSRVWNRAILSLGFINAPVHWDLVLDWLPRASNDRVRSLALLPLWNGCIYTIWRERNARFHLGLIKSEDVLVRDVIKLTKVKSTAMKNGGSNLGARLVGYVWFRGRDAYRVATGSNLVDQVKILLSNFGILDLE